MNKKIVFIFGVIFGVLVVKSADKAHKLFENKKKEREIFVDKKQKLQEDGFCYCQDIQERDKIDFDFLTKKTIRNIELGQSFVDIFAVQDIDIQKKVMKEIFNKVKNIKPENNSNIYVTSDIHGDILMLLRGLLKSGLVSWNGEMKIDNYMAYKNKTLKVVYPKVKINQNFKGVYVNLGDIVNKRPFGITSLHLLHDIYEMTKDKNGENKKVKIVIGNHEYADMLMDKLAKYSPYKQTLLKFIDMFEVYYEQNGISFTHAPLPSDIKPNNKNEIYQLKKQLLNDKDYKVKHVLWGVSGDGDVQASARVEQQDKIAKCNVSGHTHGVTDLGYNNRDDVLNVATDRFNKDVEKRGVIFSIDIDEKKVYSYTLNNNEIQKNELDKNLFNCD